jgi:hypothetical protein
LSSLELIDRLLSVVCLLQVDMASNVGARFQGFIPVYLCAAVVNPGTARIIASLFNNDMSSAFS